MYNALGKLGLEEYQELYSICAELRKFVFESI